MSVDEFLIAVSQADFIKIVGPENMFKFAEYVSRVEDQDKIVIRVLDERRNTEDDFGWPYYLWLVYSKEEHEVEIIFPDFEYPLTQIDVPEEIEGLEYFPVEKYRRRKE